MSDKLLYQSYAVAGHNEHALTTQFDDPISSAHILFIPPLFAEMNKMRRTLVQTMDLLADHHIKSTMPDLPGCHESMQPLDTQSLSDWQNAIKSCAKQYETTHIASFRGGALLDNIDLPVWRINSVKGANIIKTMLRSKIIASKESGHDVTLDQLSETAAQSGIELAGYDISAEMFSQLQNAVPEALDNAYEVKVGQQVDGTPLWMRSEPEYDPIMAQSMAQSISNWCQGKQS